MRELSRKAERVGNFRLFRTFAPCGAKERIDAIKVTNLEGSWGVVIPMSFGIYSIIISLFETGDENDEKVLHTIFCNWYAVTAIADGDFHMDIQKAQANLIEKLGKLPEEEISEEEYKRMEMAEEAREVLEEETKKEAESHDPASHV